MKTFYFAQDNKSIEQIIKAPCQFMAVKEYARLKDLKEENLIEEPIRLKLAERFIENERMGSWVQYIKDIKIDLSEFRSNTADEEIDIKSEYFYINAIKIRS